MRLRERILNERVVRDIDNTLWIIATATGSKNLDSTAEASAETADDRCVRQFGIFFFFFFFFFL